MGAGEAVERQLSHAEERDRSQPLLVEPELELETDMAVESRRTEAPVTPNKDNRRRSLGLESEASVLRRDPDAKGPEARDCASLRLPTAILRLS